jgi:vancomycin resistance protein VanW
VIIKPGQQFSFWKQIGRPSLKRGYVNGMLLSQGKVLEGPGGGLCQLSNLLYWLFLHSPLTITQRQHHSYDVFPDSGRVLPFGSGATVFYNLIDLQIKNNTHHTFQIKLNISENFLEGELRADHDLATYYHIYEKEHYFIKHNQRYYRYNEIHRQTKDVSGNILNDEKITTNLAPVMYKIEEEKLKAQGIKIIEIAI